MTTPEAPEGAQAPMEGLVVVGYRRKVPILSSYSYEVCWHWSTKKGDGWEPIYGVLSEGEQAADAGAPVEAARAALSAKEEEPVALFHVFIADGRKEVSLTPCPAAHALQLGNHALFTVKESEADRQARTNDLTRATLAGQAHGIELGRAMAKDEGEAEAALRELVDLCAINPAVVCHDMPLSELTEFLNAHHVKVDAAWDRARSLIRPHGDSGSDE